MVDRATPDLYGMAARQHARELLEALAQQGLEDDDAKRRQRTMSPDDWQALLDNMPPEVVQRLLAGFGG